MIPDPFTIVYDGLWKVVKAHPNWEDFFKDGNVIRYDTANRFPLKQQVNVSDLPELVLVPSGTVLGLQVSSNGTSITKRFQFLLSTGDFRVAHLLFPIQWLLATAFINANAVMKSLLYDGKPFVSRITVTDVAEGESDATRNRNIQGWSSIWTVEVEMQFLTASIRPELGS